jgi:hypothetical protein
MENKFRRILRFIEIPSVVVGWVMSAISYVSIFYDFNFAQVDWHTALGVSMLFVLFMTTVTLWDLHSSYVWAARPSIELKPETQDVVIDGRKAKSFTLSVFNKESMAISKCFATLESATDIFVARDEETKIMSLRTSDVVSGELRNIDRVKWVEKYPSKRHEITVPSKTPKILNVALNLDDFGFNLGKGVVQSNFLLNAKLHILKIRLDGKYNEKDINPKFFEGYIYIDGGKAFFKSGDWCKDEEISRLFRETATQESIQPTTAGTGWRARLGRSLVRLGQSLVKSSN